VALLKYIKSSCADCNYIIIGRKYAKGVRKRITRMHSNELHKL